MYKYTDYISFSIFLRNQLFDQSVNAYNVIMTRVERACKLFLT